MAPSKSIFLCLLVVVASTGLQAGADVTTSNITEQNPLPQANRAKTVIPPTCPIERSGIGSGPVAAQTFTKKEQDCFISTIQAEWQAAKGLVPNLSAKLSRMQFHDAASGHQDGSLALNQAETEVSQNANIQGVKALALFKDRIFRNCQRNVSWADTLVLAAAIGYQRSGGPSMASLVPLGRADSAAMDCCLNNFPNPFAGAAEQLQSYQNIFGPKYSAGDVLRLMITLTGAHSLGTAACLVARTSASAPTDIDPKFLVRLQQACKKPTCPTPRVPLDTTNARFDNGYFKDVIAKKGVMISDHTSFYPGTCIDGVCTSQLISAYAGNQGLFFANFKWAYCQLSIIGTNLTCPPSLTFQEPRAPSSKSLV